MRKPDIVAILEKHPNGMRIEKLAEKMGLTVSTVRNRIDTARYSRRRWNIKNVAPYTFKLCKGKWTKRKREGR